MFILRCAFFLSIVWVSIVCGAGTMRHSGTLEAAIATEASGIAKAAAAHAADWCAERPARCARDAARLTALVETTAQPLVGVDEEVIPDMPRRPMPMPDPRRRAARAMLTGAF